MKSVNFELIHSSKLSEIYFDASSKILKNVWKTKTISLEEMQDEMRIWMKYFSEKKPALILTNNEIGQLIVPEIQDWVGGFLFPEIIVNGAKKWAIVLSGDLFSNVSVEQMLEETKKPTDEFAMVYFENNENAAIEWLSSFI